MDGRGMLWTHTKRFGPLRAGVSMQTLTSVWQPSFQPDGSSAQTIWKPLAYTWVGSGTHCWSRFKEIHFDEISFKTDCPKYRCVLQTRVINFTSGTIVVYCRPVWSIPPAELSWCTADACNKSHQRNYRGVLQTHVINPTSGTIVLYWRHEWSIPPAELSWCTADTCNQSHQPSYTVGQPRNISCVLLIITKCFKTNSFSPLLCCPTGPYIIFL